uniref:Extensin-like n=1 Tax=Caenorhabditis tropicalis TaxID=1561998 RepID=A0A1I7TBM0_9PELO
MPPPPGNQETRHPVPSIRKAATVAAIQKPPPSPPSEAEIQKSRNPEARTPEARTPEARTPEARTHLQKPELISRSQLQDPEAQAAAPAPSDSYPPPPPHTHSNDTARQQLTLTPMAQLCHTAMTDTTLQKELFKCH